MIPTIYGRDHRTCYALRAGLRGLNPRPRRVGVNAPGPVQVGHWPRDGAVGTSIPIPPDIHRSTTILDEGPNFPLRISEHRKYHKACEGCQTDRDCEYAKPLNAITSATGQHRPASTGRNEPLRNRKHSTNHRRPSNHAKSLVALMSGALLCANFCGLARLYLFPLPRLPLMRVVRGCFRIFGPKTSRKDAGSWPA